MRASAADLGSANGKHSVWWLAGFAIVGCVYFAWTAVSGMRSGYISVKKTFLGFAWWSEVNSDDQPIQFWSAVIAHWIASAGCLVGLVFLLKYGTSQ